MAKSKYCDICGVYLNPYDTYQFQDKLVCAECNKIISENQDITIEQVLLEKKKVQEKNDDYIIVTVPKIEGKKIVKYFSMITCEITIGTGFVSEKGAAVSDMFGTIGAYGDKLETIKEKVYDNLKKRAIQKGANAIVGANAEYMIVGSNMIMFSISGTPVIIEDE